MKKTLLLVLTLTGTYPDIISFVEIFHNRNWYKGWENEKK